MSMIDTVSPATTGFDDRMGKLPPKDLADLMLPRLEAPRSDDYNVGTFNAFGNNGYDKQSEVDEIGQFVAGTGPYGDKALDIVGFQEVGDRQQPAAQVAGEMARRGMNGYMGDSGNPIFWDAEKFDVVHQETLVIHDKNKLPEGDGVPEHIGEDQLSDQRRTTAFVVLKDKDSGAEILVTNRQQDHTFLDHDQFREAHQALSNAKADEIKEQFSGISARIDLGDFNSGSDEIKRPDFRGENATGNDDWDTQTQPDRLDYIMSEGFENDTSARNETTHAYDKVPGEHYFNSDKFQHPMLSQTITVTPGKEELDAASGDRALEGNGAGAVFYEKDNYGGDAWAAGFGRDGFSRFDHKEWNDRTSSISVTPDAEMKVYKDTDGDETGREIHENVTNIGKDWNDKISAFELGGA